LFVVCEFDATPGPRGPLKPGFFPTSPPSSDRRRLTSFPPGLVVGLSSSGWPPSFARPRCRVPQQASHRGAEKGCVFQFELQLFPMLFRPPTPPSAHSFFFPRVHGLSLENTYDDCNHLPRTQLLPILCGPPTLPVSEAFHVCGSWCRRFPRTVELLFVSLNVPPPPLVSGARSFVLWLMFAPVVSVPFRFFPHNSPSR